MQTLQPDTAMSPLDKRGISISGVHHICRRPTSLPRQHRLLAASNRTQRAGNNATKHIDELNMVLPFERAYPASHASAITDPALHLQANLHLWRRWRSHVQATQATLKQGVPRDSSQNRSHPEDIRGHDARSQSRSRNVSHELPRASVLAWFH